MSWESRFEYIKNRLFRPLSPTNVVFKRKGDSSVSHQVFSRSECSLKISVAKEHLALLFSLQKSRVKIFVVYVWVQMYFLWKVFWDWGSNVLISLGIRVQHQILNNMKPHYSTKHSFVRGIKIVCILFKVKLVNWLNLLIHIQSLHIDYVSTVRLRIFSQSCMKNL
jgi:hypothetical protein